MTWRRTISSTSVVVAIISIAIVLASFYADAQNTSPGAVAAVHAHLIKGAISQDCASCHGTGSQTMTDACMDCHQDIARQLTGRRGFHSLLDAEVSQDCGKCHSDHHGTDFQITNARSFQLAGIGDPLRYDHAGLDLRLTGKHLAIGCEECHAEANTTLLTKGTKRFLGLDQNCTSCHEDVHKRAYGQDCASCHGQEHPFARAASFKHTAAFALVGAHGKAACIDCHQKDTKYAVDTLLASVNTRKTADEEAVRACRECHHSPHKETFLANVAQVLNLNVDASCEHCHKAAHDTFLGPAASIDIQLHALTGFSLEPPHNKASCESCHEGYGRQKTRFVSLTDPPPIRRADNCQACHKDPHAGQFADGQFGGQGCLACHERHTFHPPAFGIAEHSQTKFSLRGVHRLLECNQCHKFSSTTTSVTDADKLVATRVFHGTPDSCRACHEDPHRGQFSYEGFRDADCSACHDEHSFRHPTFSIEQHDHSRFPLTGAHKAVACSGCHKSTIHSTFANGETLVSRQFHGTPVECASCHEDVHGGVFDRRGLPATLGGKKGCARCHSTESFSDVRADSFDHGEWTGYELRGAHANAKCAACHLRDGSDTPARTIGKAANRQCQSCHADPHVGQFGSTAIVDCSRCHLEGTSFSELTFEHQKHSDFKLDRIHEKLECSACHKPQRLRSGKTAVRYKPLGSKCGDCHIPSGPRTTSTRARR